MRSRIAFSISAWRRWSASSSRVSPSRSVMNAWKSYSAKSASWDPGGRLHPADDEPDRDRVRLARKGGVRRLGDVGSTGDPIRDRRPGVVGDRLDELPDAAVLADRDAEADLHRPPDRDDGVAIEAAVGPHRELAARAGGADPADRLAQEVAGAAGGVGAALAEPRHEDVAGPGRDRQERLIAADLRIGEPGGPLLLEPVRLADRRVEINREGSRARTRAGCPGPGDARWRCSSTSAFRPRCWASVAGRRSPRRPPDDRRRRPRQGDPGCAMIASIRCSSGPGRWLCRNTIIPVQMGTCSPVPNRESGRAVGGSGLSDGLVQAHSHRPAHN